MQRPGQLRLRLTRPTALGLSPATQQARRLRLSTLASAATLATVLLGAFQFPGLPGAAAQDAAQPKQTKQKAFEEAGWRFTLRKPRRGWEKPDFDDGRWAEGFGGFGTPGTPGARIGTTWETHDIWLRKRLELDAVPEQAALLIHHDEDAEVYLNGEQVGAFQGYLTEYKVVPLSDKAQALLKQGTNVLAVHCHQDVGGQFIDVHVVDAANVPKLPAPKRKITPFQSELITEWGARVTPDNVWQEYPRPGLARENWVNLNGKWDYAIAARDDESVPAEWDGKILVPFCLESRLSGVQRLLDPDESLWYRRTFEMTPAEGRRVKLNFEAVDYACTVSVNGKVVGRHTGGNTPFSFDITEALKAGQNELILRVLDETEGSQLRGKQTLTPRGIWYTQVSGIWQTVWLEEVAPRHFRDVKIHTDADAGTITVTPRLEGYASDGERMRVQVYDGDELVATQEAFPNAMQISIEQPKLWSPKTPHLYDLTIAVLDAQGEVIDQVTSYAGIRSVGKTRDDEGHLRFTLNGEILFHLGPLDQGWWPDGLLTPPSDEGMLYDIEFLKDAGFNMIRKHIKVEPRRYYYHCDRLGMLVWQDQVSGGPNPPWTRLQADPQDAEWSESDHKQFMYEFAEMVDALENHPSIVVWTPFNEAWGQHRSVEVGQWIAQRDPSRLVNIASGGNFWPVGDIVDAHRYPHPGFPFDPERYQDYIHVMGEFGGHGWPVQGHLWDNSRRNWGYGGLPQTIKEYEDRYIESIRLLKELKEQGIAAGVYTQTTDVEGEINGLMTYDRKRIKIPASRLRQINQVLYEDETSAANSAAPARSSPGTVEIGANDADYALPGPEELQSFDR